MGSAGRLAMEQFSVSCAMSESGQIAVLENRMSKILEQSQTIATAIRERGRLLLTHQEVLQWIGELFTLRVALNNENSAYNSFFWDRLQLDELSAETAQYLDLAARRGLMNRRLTYMAELAELIRTTRSEQMSVRLEWGIIVLIVIEVLFECSHYVERLGVVG
jgi:uncharacterized Rmd1/YagE family protein